MAEVSTPTISRFENGEKNIQLSSVISILSILGMNDNRHLVFPTQDENYDAFLKVITFSGKDGSKIVHCAISKEVLEDYFNATTKNILKKFQEHREKIQQEIRRKYLLEKLENDGSILLSLKDLIS